VSENPYTPAQRKALRPVFCFVCGKEILKKRNVSEARRLEQKYCSRPCFGIARKGHEVTTETREKLRLSHKGTKKPWAGKYHRSGKHIEILKENGRNTWEKHREELIKKLSLSRKGVKISAERVEKIKELWKKDPRYKGGKETEKERRAFYQKRREARKRDSGGSHTLEEWINLLQETGNKCSCCGVSAEKTKLTEDHITPITKGGNDNIENIQPLCAPCNSKKMTKHINYKQANKILNEILNDANS
jgi:5-methylcytosine-specific restriction endonuclease McrA